MAVTHALVTVSSVAIALNSASGGGERMWVRNTHATEPVILGGPGVTAGTGFPLTALTSIDVELDAGDVLFGIRPAATDVPVAVLRT